MSNSNNTEEVAHQPIKVYVRLRPFNEHEKQTTCLEIKFQDIYVKSNIQKKFSFDEVFGPDSRQTYVYKTIGKPLISEILEGYNCTVFAYGQTGTGKTFTMSGGLHHLNITCSNPAINHIAFSSIPEEVFLNDKSGLIPRVVSELFDELRSFSQQYTVQCSYLELYNEDLRDLLAVGDDAVPVRIFGNQRQKGAVIIQGIQEVTVNSKMEVYNLLHRGNEKRQIAATQMNDHSSRSHTVFTLIVHTRENGPNGEDIIRTGKLNLVDLAGSENISRSGAVDRRAREAGNINQSLLTLGRVIKALAENSCHIPFRESKLTRILQDSLGGRTKTIIIATISPCLLSLDETISTLDYAYKARVITNKPEVNQRMSQKALMNQYAEEKASLERDLEAARSQDGVILDPQNYERLLVNQQTSIDQISQKTALILDLEQQLKLLEEEKELHEAEYVALTKSFEQTSNELERTKVCCDKVELEKKEQEYLAMRYEQNARNLHKEAQSLLTKIQSSSVNEKILHEKIEHLYKIAAANYNIMKKMSADVGQVCDGMLSEFANQQSAFENFHSDIQKFMTVSITQQDTSCNKIIDFINLIKDEYMSNSFENSFENFDDWKRERFSQLQLLMNDLNNLHLSGRSQFDSLIKTFFETEARKKQILLTNFKVRLYEITSFSTSSSDGLLMDMETMKTQVLSELSKLIQGLLVQPNNIDISKSLIKELRSELIQMVNERFNDIRKHLMCNKSQIQQNIACVKHMQSVISTGLPNIHSKIETNSDVVSTIMSDDSFRAIEHCNSNETVNKYSELIDNCTSQIAENNVLGENRLLESSLENAYFVNDIAKNNLVMLTSHQNNLSQNCCENLEQISTISNEIKLACSEIDENATITLDNLNDHSQSTQSFIADTTNKLNSLEKLAGCNDKDVLEAQPTGNTPVHTKVEYPSKLKQLTPKDRVLLKFRLMESGDTANVKNSSINED